MMDKVLQITNTCVSLVFTFIYNSGGGLKSESKFRPTTSRRGSKSTITRKSQQTITSPDGNFLVFFSGGGGGGGTLLL